MRQSATATPDPSNAQARPGGVVAAQGAGAQGDLVDQMSRLKEAFKLALSMVLFYWLALSMNWDLAKYGVTVIILVSLDTTGASLRKGAMRVVGTMVGLVFGLIGISLFVQDRWATMAFFATYVVILNYFMLGSRFAYAWFVAGFVAPLIWSATYMKSSTAFHFAAYRYLETTAGIIIFTLVSVLLWPRTSADKLARQGTELWNDVHALFGRYRRQLMDGELPADAADRSSGLPRKISQLLETLDESYVDNRAVAEQKRVWEILHVNALAVGDAIALWAQTIVDARPLVLQRPELIRATEALDQRFGRIVALWRSAMDEGGVSGAADDETLLQPLSLGLESAPAAGQSHYDHAVLMSYRQQLGILDEASRALLGSLRSLAGLGPSREHRLPAPERHWYRPSFWQSDRLIEALYPALCFVVGFIFWIYVNPPPGTLIPMMALTFGMTVILSRMTTKLLWAELIVGLTAVTVLAGPISFLLLPRLSTGFELMALIFVYVFVAGYIGTRQPIVKVLLLNMLVVVDITNDQSYSFLGLANGMLMLYLTLGGVATLLMLVGPGRPEQILLRSVNRFFDGCGRIVGEYSLNRSQGGVQAYRRRRHYYESMVLPASGRLQAAEKSLEYKVFPDNTPDKVRRLVDCVQSIGFRLRALEIAYQRFVRSSPAQTELFGPLGQRLQQGLQRVFAAWAGGGKADDLSVERAALQDIARELEQRLDARTTTEASGGQDERASEELYSLLGCLRGLIGAMQDAQRSMRQINWSQWSEARF